MSATLCLILLLAAPAADKKPTADKKAAEKRAPTVDEAMAQAEEKAKAGDLDGAVELLRKAAAMEGASGEPSLRLGRLLETRSEMDAAMDAYRAASEKLQGKAKGEALGRLAAIQEMRGIPEAASTAEAAAVADPAGGWPLIALSRERARQGKTDEALELAQKATAAGGGAGASAAVGYAQEARGDLTAAEAAYREAIAAEPARMVASVGLARVLRKTGRAADAEPMLTKILETTPGAVDAYKERARVRMALNRPADAMEDASLAAAMAEGDAEAQLLGVQVSVARALASIPSGQLDLAIQDLTALRDKNPGVAEARVGLARALIAKRQIDPAVAELQKAIELKPELAEAHYQMGYVRHAIQGNAVAAVASYEKAVAADPGNVEYRTYLGAALSDPTVKQFDRGVEELSKVTGSPGYARPEAWIYLGRAHLAAKRYKDAIAALDKAVAIAPSNADAEASLGWCYFGLKDAENFKKHAGRARSLGHKEPTLLGYLTRIEAGEPIK